MRDGLVGGHMPLNSREHDVRLGQSLSLGPNSFIIHGIQLGSFHFTSRPLIFLFFSTYIFKINIFRYIHIIPHLHASHSNYIKKKKLSLTSCN